ncbi:MAG TPA: hypothetical protein VFF69_04225 [Phycisphaerales bacterium]|nr:hypothetical protein [Phycisphaerales bacterium]
MAGSRPECPRCAYDLSGLVESWSGFCPLDGRCSECGLGFEWRDVLSSGQRLPRWSFEHAPDRRLFRAFFATLLRALAPPRLWGALRMEMEIVPGRLRLLVMLGNAVFKVMGLAVLGGTLAMTWRLSPNGWRSPSGVEAVLLVLWPYGEYGTAYWGGYLVSAWVVIVALAVLLTPLTFYLLPVSMRRARVRRAHIARVQAYVLALLVPAIGVWSLLHTAVTALFEFSPYIVWELGLGELPIGPTAACAVGVWLLWAWHSAVKRYLRLPHALAVALAMLAIAWLAASVPVVLTYGHALF